MKIQVLGPGCGSCKQLHEQVLKAVKELNMDTEVEYVTDIQKIAEAGIMSSPALIIEGKVASAGTVPTVEKIKEMISGENSDNTESKSSGCCSCGGKC
ncbi:TPA: hypothetical protein DD449_01240 [Candidatus Berkelbacteria bacterium]|uniref:Redox-active disulfide protein 2 n=1 Tax=Berkelbacteria bacterium GW2011_GWE1_39_12 TaxID=1618337 RepID=A0A0G4B3T1_9BACT|nr:MAG: redox-active disulfide protein 2 [Berkelbacteria bacterium GW2011_GWE1_39_12]HBO60296.1 hypothetical protein [Candidatus Berkelbacteria bacterium]